MDYLNKLIRTGFVTPIAGTIDVDLTATHGGSVCDHNCTTRKGGYNCPASASLNKTIRPLLAPAGRIVEWTEMAVDGLQQYHKEFVLDGRLDNHCYENSIPVDVRKAMSELYKSEIVEVNLTGGNPEMHPSLLDIIRSISYDVNTVINLSCTGRRFITDPTFAVSIIDAGVDRIQLSMGGATKGLLEELLNMEFDELKRKWQTVNLFDGRKQRVIEGVFALKLFADTGVFKTVDFVITPENYGHADSVINTLSTELGAEVNPYVYQTGFSGDTAKSKPGFITWLGNFIDIMIEYTMADILVVPRLHYWLFMKAIFVTCGENSIKEKMVSGGSWRCYTNPIRPHIQIGRGIEANEMPGGFLGCFWNEAITDYQQMTDADAVYEYLKLGMSRTSLDSLVKAKSCGGCMFPTMMVDVISAEAGMNPMFKPAYLDLRKQYMGY